MKFFITKKKLVKEFAKKIASLQKYADKQHYIAKDRSMCLRFLDKVIPLKDMCLKLGICDEVYNEAYKIYDFRNSGKPEYTLKGDKIVKIEGEIVIN